MNAKDLLDFTYIPSEYEEKGKIIKHLVCQVKSKKSGQSFTSLGLNEGQTVLTDQQMKWFDTHCELVANACDACDKAWKDYITTKKQDQVHTWKISYDESLLPVYRKASKYCHSLLDKFCKECNIKDS